MKPILTKQRFRRNRAHHQVVFKSAMGKMTGGSVGTFHVVGRKLGLLSNLHLRGGSPYFSIYCLINSFFHEQLLRQSVLIYIYIYILDGWMDGLVD